MSRTPLAQIHDCPNCRCGLPRCPSCGHVLPDHQETPCIPVEQWCPRSPVVRAIKADEKRRGVYDPETWR